MKSKKKKKSEIPEDNDLVKKYFTELIGVVEYEKIFSTY